MATATIYGIPITFQEKTNLGLYFDETGGMPLDYRVSTPKEVIKVANKFLPNSTRISALLVVDCAKRQLNHPQQKHIPKRFKKGLENTIQFYQLIADTIEQVSAVRSANHPS